MPNSRKGGPSPSRDLIREQLQAVVDRMLDDYGDLVALASIVECVGQSTKQVCSQEVAPLHLAPEVEGLARSLVDSRLARVPRPPPR